MMKRLSPTIKKEKSKEEEKTEKAEIEDKTEPNTILKKDFE